MKYLTIIFLLVTIFSHRDVRASTVDEFAQIHETLTLEELSQLFKSTADLLTSEFHITLERAIDILKEQVFTFIRAITVDPIEIQELEEFFEVILDSLLLPEDEYDYVMSQLSFPDDNN